MRHGTALTAAMILGWVLIANDLCPWWFLAVSFVAGTVINAVTKNRSSVL